MIADAREHPVFAGFELPENPYCSKADGDFKRGVDIRTLKTALRRPHVQVNPPWLWSFLLYDVDGADGETRWHDRGLPMPRWNAINRENGHSHTAYGLKSPVLLGENCQDAPLRWASAVESALREQIGGDVAYSGLLTKNPVHPEHRVLWGGKAYELDELAAFLPDLGKHRPLPHIRVEDYGIGRNVAVFNHVRFHAYREIRRHWDGGLDSWMAYLGDLAHDFTCIEHSNPLNRAETRGIGRSVGQWTWARMSPENWARKQARRGKAGGLASGTSRRARNAERDAEIVRLATAGKATQRAIAGRYGISQQAVSLIVKRNTSEAISGVSSHSASRIARPSAKRRKIPAPAALPENADMLPVEPLQPVAETADVPPVEPSAEDARRENARQWIANLLPDRKPSARKWTRKEPKPCFVTGEPRDGDPDDPDWMPF